MSPEQMRKKSMAMEESQRHARYSQADRERDASEPMLYQSPGIAMAGREVSAATAKEDSSIGGENASVNDNRY
jgi:hypothetical protein